MEKNILPILTTTSDPSDIVCILETWVDRIKSNAENLLRYNCSKSTIFPKHDAEFVYGLINNVSDELVPVPKGEKTVCACPNEVEQLRSDTNSMIKICLKVVDVLESEDPYPLYPEVIDDDSVVQHVLGCWKVM